MTAASSSSADGRCMARVQSALGDMMSAASTVTKNGGRRQTPPSGIMDLSGYALHQRLRTAPGAEMYVTGMRAKVMPPRDAATAESATGAGDHAVGDHRSWARVDGCQYDPLGNTLEARMRFGRVLMVSGSVKVLYGNGDGRTPTVDTGCDMTLRLRPRAGLGFTAVPLTVPEKLPPDRLTATPTMTIRTTATFIDPEPVADDPTAAYVSVHSYNCVGGAAGNREQPAASSDRFEQIASAEDDSDELQQSAGGGYADFDDADIDADDGSAEFGFRPGRRRPSPPPPPPSATKSATPKPTAATTINPYVHAGFVSQTTTTTGPEPRLRKIQYRGKPSQHPMLAVANGYHGHYPSQDQLLMEMEEVFVRGVRSLLAKHMERALQPVLKDSLMANMGYTVSYG